MTRKWILNRTTASLSWLLVVSAFALGTVHCASEKKESIPCKSEAECTFGMVCFDGECVDRGMTGNSQEDRAAIHDMLQKDEALRRTTEQCRLSAGCQNRGKCQGTPSGDCIVAEQEHCENAKVTCKGEGKCTYVPAEYACCETAMGSVCERPE